MLNLKKIREYRKSHTSTSPGRIVFVYQITGKTEEIALLAEDASHGQKLFTDESGVVTYRSSQILAKSFQFDFSAKGRPFIVGASDADAKTQAIRNKITLIRKTNPEDAVELEKLLIKDIFDGIVNNIGTSVRSSAVMPTKEVTAEEVAVEAETTIDDTIENPAPAPKAKAKTIK